MKNNQVVAVVVTYNRVKLLRECISSLLSQQLNINHLIVINNNSSDGTTKYLQQINDERLMVHNLPNNIGGAAGFELGLKYAFEETNDEYIWFMDDDTIPEKDAWSSLYKAAAFLKNDFGFLCSNVRWTNGLSTNVPSVVQKWPDYIDQGLIRISKATFVSVVVTRRNLAKLGLPISQMVIWGDDTEFTTRFSSNLQSFFVTDSHVLHKTVNNLMDDSITSISLDRINRYKYMYRNLIFINRKYHGRRSELHRAITNFRDLIKVIVHAKDHKMRRCWAVIAGTWNGLFFNPQIDYPNGSGGTDEI